MSFDNIVNKYNFTPNTNTQPVEVEQQGLLGDSVDAFQRGAYQAGAGLFNFVGADGVADSLNRFADEQLTTMSDEGLSALNSEIFTEDEQGRLALGDGATNLRTWWLNIANVAGQFAPTAIPGAGVAGLVTRAANVGTRGARVAQGVSHGAFGGASATGQAGIEARSLIDEQSLDTLKDSDAYKRHLSDVVQNNPQMQQQEMLQLAKDNLGREVESNVMSDPRLLLANFGMSAIADPVISSAFRRRIASGFTGSIARGFATEAVSEGTQGGLQHYVVRDEARIANENIDPNQGLLPAVLTEATIGGGMGATAAGIGHTTSRFSAAKTGNSAIDEQLKTTEDLINSGVERQAQSAQVNAAAVQQNEPQSPQPQSPEEKAQEAEQLVDNQSVQAQYERELENRRAGSPQMSEGAFNALARFAQPGETDALPEQAKQAVDANVQDSIQTNALLDQAHQVDTELTSFFETQRQEGHIDSAGMSSVLADIAQGGDAYRNIKREVDEALEQEDRETSQRYFNRSFEERVKARRYRQQQEGLIAQAQEQQREEAREQAFDSVQQAPDVAGDYDRALDQKAEQDAAESTDIHRRKENSAQYQQAGATLSSKIKRNTKKARKRFAHAGASKRLQYQIDQALKRAQQNKNRVVIPEDYQPNSAMADAFLIAEGKDREVVVAVDQALTKELAKVEEPAKREEQAELVAELVEDALLDSSQDQTQVETKAAAEPSTSTGETQGVISEPSVTHSSVEPVSSLPEVPLVEHTTKRNRNIKGFVLDIDKEQAKEIDPYTFAKDGGYFIREKHAATVEELGLGKLSAPTENKSEISVGEAPNVDTDVAIGDSVTQGNTVEPSGTQAVSTGTSLVASPLSELTRQVHDSSPVDTKKGLAMSLIRKGRTAGIDVLSELGYINSGTIKDQQLTGRTKSDYIKALNTVLQTKGQYVPSPLDSYGLAKLYPEKAAARQSRFEKSQQMRNEALSRARERRYQAQRQATKKHQDELMRQLVKSKNVDQLHENANNAEAGDVPYSTITKGLVTWVNDNQLNDRYNFLGSDLQRDDITPTIDQKISLIREVIDSPVEADKTTETEVKVSSGATSGRYKTLAKGEHFIEPNSGSPAQVLSVSEDGARVVYLDYDFEQIITEDDLNEIGFTVKADKLANDVNEEVTNESNSADNQRQPTSVESTSRSNETVGVDDGSGGTSGTGREQSKRVSPNDASARSEKPSNSRSVDTTTANLFSLDTVGDIANGTDSERVAANLEAIRTLKRIQSENRPATDSEKATLAQYVGWGGLAFVFDPGTKRQYAKAADTELKSLLTETEYNNVRGTVSTAFFTSETVVKAMWDGVKAFGLGKGKMNVIEPSVGSGNFIGWQPQTMRNKTSWSATELDTVTGNIAALIYDDANVVVKGYQDAKFKPGVFSLAIGNPPFGSMAVTDTQYPDISGLSLHNYMIAKSAKLLHEDGLMMKVITSRFLDTENQNHRELSKTMEFLGAVRLPNTAFKSNAGTEVTTDIVIFKKLKDGETAKNKVWADTNGQVNGVRINKYFEQNPQNILGRVAADGTMYGSRSEPELTVHPTDEHQDLQASIRSAIEKIAENTAMPTTNEVAERVTGEVMLSESELPIGGMMINADGKVLLREDDNENGANVVELSKDTIWSESGEVLKQLAEFGKDQQALKAFAQQNIINPKTGKPKTVFSAKVFTELAAFVDDRTSFKNYKKSLDAAIERAKLGATRFAKLRAMLDIRNTALALIRAERLNTDNINSLRKQLNQQYDEFATTFKQGKKLATIDENINLLRGDISIESGLDSYNKSTGQVRKHDIFTKRMIQPYETPSSASSIDDAVNFSIQEKGNVSIVYVAELLGISQDKAKSQLTSGDKPYLLFDPALDKHVFIDDYLSGNVKQKLEAARNEGLEVNTKLLESVQPKPKPVDKVVPSIRATWIDKDIFEMFLTALGVNAKVSVSPSIGSIRISSSSPGAKTVLGDQFTNADTTLDKLFEHAASGKAIQIYRTTGKDSRVKDEDATKRANALVNKLSDSFKTWAESNPTVKQRIADNFNERVNTHIERSYNGRLYLKTIGQNPVIELRKTQLDGALRMIQSENVLLDHTVGAGKTFTAITGIMQRKRLGLSNKPVLAVPNHIIGAFAADFYALYPGANILMATEKQMSAKNRKQFFSRMATGDYDAIIIGHSHLKFLPNDVEVFESVINEKISELRQALEDRKREAKESGGRGASVKQIEDSIKRLKNKIEQRKKEIAAKEDAIGFTFSDLGIDYLTVDEAHEFKNLMYSTSGDRVVGMNNPQGSDRALDLLIKTRAIQNNVENGGVTFMTGTPISNSLVELYTMMYYLGHKDLVSNNISHYDAFAGAFVNTEMAMEYTATGTVKERRVLKGLNAIKELTAKYRQFADVITHQDMLSIYADDVEKQNQQNGTNKSTRFPVPNVSTGGRQLLTAQTSDRQRQYADYLIARMEAIEAVTGREERRKYAKIDNPLWVLSDAKKSSLDVRLVDPKAERDLTGKVQRSANEIKQRYDQTHEDKGTQLVFSDMGVPAKSAIADTKSELIGLAKLIMSDKQAKAFVNKQLSLHEKGQAYEQTFNNLLERIDAAVADGSADADVEAKASEKAESIKGGVFSADTGFSVYDDLKAALVEKGIPAKEIAFIHDYKTVEQKAKLFEQVNEGKVRVLIGSTAKMGAGTNVQKRLVALHHLDAPWRPSDMEQREGRIIRQGNMFYEAAAAAGKPDEFEVDILAYSTEGSSDPVMWQILERKASAIEQFRRVEIDEYIQEDNSDADSYANFKAQTTGNEIYKLKLEAEGELTKAEADYMADSMTYDSAVRTVEYYEASKATYQARIKAFTSQSIDKSALSKFTEQHQSELEKYQNAYEQYEADADYYLSLDDAERKQLKVKKPTPPKRKAIYQYTNPYSKQLKKALDTLGEDIASQVDSSVQSVELSPGVKLEITAEQNFGAKDLYTLSAHVISNGRDVEVSYAMGVKTATGSKSFINGLSLPAINAKLTQEVSYTRSRLKSLESDYKEALPRTKSKPSKDELKRVQRENTWLEAETKVADIKEQIRRSEVANDFIDGEQQRRVKRSTFDKSTIKQSKVIVQSKRYTTYGIALDSPLWSHYGVQAVPAKDSRGEFVHLFMPKDEKATDVFTKLPADSLIKQRVLRNPGDIASEDKGFLEDLSEGNHAQASQANELHDPIKGFARQEPQDNYMLVGKSGVAARDSRRKTFIEGLTSANRDNPTVTKVKALQIVRRITRGWQDKSVNFRFFDGWNDLTAVEQERLGSAEKVSKMGGVYQNDTRTVMINYDNINTEAAIEYVVFHEALRHYGIRKYLGIRYQRTMETLFNRLGEDRLKAIFTKSGADYEGYKQRYNNDPVRLMDEAIALIEPDDVTPTIWERIEAQITRFKLFLERKGYKRLVTALGGFKEQDVFHLAMFGAEQVKNIEANGESNKATSGEFDNDEGMYLIMPEASNIDNQPTLDQVLATQKSTVYEKVKQALLNNKLVEGFKNQRLGTLTLRQLSEIGRDHLPGIARYVDTVHAMITTRNQLAGDSAEVVENWERWANKNKADADTLTEVMHDSTLANVDPSEVFVEAAEMMKERVRIVELLLKERGAEGMTGRKKELFLELKDLRKDIASEPQRKKLHEKLRARFLAMPTEAQTHFVQVKNNYQSRHNTFKEIMLGRIEQAEMDGKQKKEILAKMRFEFERQALMGVYFPLSRFGDYYIETTDENGERVFMTQETEAEQQRVAKQLKAGGYPVKSGKFIDKDRDADGASLGFIHDAIAMVADADKLTEEGKSEVADGLYQLYLQNMPTRSMRKQFIHRKGVKGFSQDAIRGYANNMMKSAYQLSRLERMDELSEGMEDMRKQAKQAGNNFRSELYNEMQKRHQWVMNPTHSAMSQKLTSLGFVYMLGLSPAAAAVNTTQNFVVALPAMAARFGNMESAKALANTTKEFMAEVFKKNGTIEGALKGDELDAYKQWHDSGLLDNTRSHDLAGLSEGDSFNYSPKQQKAMNTISYLFHKAEVYNRETTAIAAYRLARSKPMEGRTEPMTHAQAVKFAESLTWDAHFDYTNVNRARFMQNGFMKVATQFKQYSQNMTYFLVRNAHQAMKGHTKEERAIARRTLVGTLGMTALLGGLSAMPLWGVYALANAFLGYDEDEPWDAETELKAYLVDTFGKDTADTMLYGVGGAGISPRISLDGMWVRSPFRDLEGEDQWAHYAKQVAGPVLGGILPSALRGLDKLREGEVQRGFEMMLPKAYRDLSKAQRFSSEGALNNKGDQLKAAEDFELWQVMLQGLGLSDAEVNKQYMENSAIKGYERKILDRRAALMTRYYLSIRDGDIAERREVLKAIARFNRINPGVALTRQSLSRSVKSRERYRQNSINGINVNRNLRYLVNEYDLAN